VIEVTISVQTIIEIQNLYQRYSRSKNTKTEDQKEINELLSFCARIAASANRNHILTDEAVYQLFELIYKISLKKQRDSENFISNVVKKCFSDTFFKVLVKLKQSNIYSKDIFKLLWENQVYIDNAFLQLIELMINDKELEQNDILLVGKFPKSANHIYLCLRFLSKYKLDRFKKSLYEQAEFAKTLWEAWSHLVDKEVPFHEDIHIPDTILNIFRAMFKSPACSLLLAKGIALLFHNPTYYFDYYKLLCNNPWDAVELAQAFVGLVYMPNYHKQNIEMITQYPRNAKVISCALNILMTNRVYATYYSYLHSNPREATVIANLVSYLETKSMMNQIIQAAIVNNARNISPLFNIVVFLSRMSCMLNLKTLYVIFDNNEYIPDIALKLTDMSAGDLTSLNYVTFNKLIEDIKEEKRKIELEKEKMKQNEAGLISRVEISPLEEIRDCERAYNYLKENIFNKKEKLDKQISIDLIKKVFLQLLQFGLNGDKKESVLKDMSSLFYLITVDYNKAMVNIHNNSRYDTFFGKTNTTAWTEMMKVIRDQAYQLLTVVVENESDSNNKIALLEEMKEKAIFAEHRTNSFFNRFHETTTVKEINKKIEALRAPVLHSLNK
jgi:hypothetical protein